MNITTTAFAFLKTRLAAVWLVFGFFLLTSPVDSEVFAASTVWSGNAMVFVQDDVAESVHPTSVIKNVHLLARSKAKSQGEFKKFTNPFSELGRPVFPVGCATSFITSLEALRPGYYRFLFRYTPF